MTEGFEYVFAEVEKFKLGVFCASSLKEEIDTPFHKHDKGQLVYTVKGTLHINTEERQYFLPVDHCIWIPKNLVHRMWTNNTSFRMFTIYFDDEVEESGFYSNTSVFSVNVLMHEMIKMARGWNGYIAKNDAVKYKFLQGLKAILPEIAGFDHLPLLAFVNPVNERLVEVIAYIRANISTKLKLEEIANRFGFSSRSLSRLFSKEGISFIEYVQSARVVKSMELLSEKNHNVNMVALHVGYESITAFSNIFLRFTGIRPAEYLQKQQNKNRLQK